MTVARRRWKRAGRHCWKARPPKPDTNPPEPSCPPNPPPCPFWPFPPWLFWLCGLAARAFVKHACIFASSAAVGGAGRWLTVMRCPPVWNWATIFGTTPSWCSAMRVSPEETAATPSSDAIRLTCCWGKVSWLPGRKKSWTKCWPGLPSFERSVRTERLLWKTSPPPRPKGPPPPVSCCAERVTLRSVPMLASGSSAFFCARSSPRVSAEMTTTSATPIARPSSGSTASRDGPGRTT